MTLQDEYSGWIDKKQFQVISEKEAKNISLNTMQYSNQLVDFIETENQSLVSIVMGSNIAGKSHLKHSFKGTFSEGVKEKSNLVKTAYLYINTPYLW